MCSSTAACQEKYSLIRLHGRAVKLGGKVPEARENGNRNPGQADGSNGDSYCYQREDPTAISSEIKAQPVPGPKSGSG